MKPSRLKERARKLKEAVPAVYMSLKDEETPLKAKILAGITILYALSPIDLIPDFIPILGYLDDLIILPALIALALRFIPADVWERSLNRSADIWKDGNPKKWYFAIPFLLLWCVIIFLAVKALI